MVLLVTRKTAEDQYFGLSVKNRRDGVDDHYVNDPYAATASSMVISPLPTL